MLDSDHAALAQVQNALVNAQQLYDQQKMKVDRLAAAGAATHDATDALGLLELYLAILQRHRDYLFAAAARNAIRSDRWIGLRFDPVWLGRDT